MTTIVEKTPDGVIYRAAKTYPVPDVDILTLLFGKRLRFIQFLGYTYHEEYQRFMNVTPLAGSC